MYIVFFFLVLSVFLTIWEKKECFSIPYFKDPGKYNCYMDKIYNLENSISPNKSKYNLQINVLVNDLNKSKTINKNYKELDENHSYWENKKILDKTFIEKSLDNVYNKITKHLAIKSRLVSKSIIKISKNPANMYKICCTIEILVNKDYCSHIFYIMYELIHSKINLNKIKVIGKQSSDKVLLNSAYNNMNNTYFLLKDSYNNIQNIDDNIIIL